VDAPIARGGGVDGGDPIGQIAVLLGDVVERVLLREPRTSEDHRVGVEMRERLAQFGEQLRARPSSRPSRSAS